MEQMRAHRQTNDQDDETEDIQAERHIALPSSLAVDPPMCGAERRPRRFQSFSLLWGQAFWPAAELSLGARKLPNRRALFSGPTFKSRTRDSSSRRPASSTVVT